MVMTGILNTEMAQSSTILRIWKRNLLLHTVSAKKNMNISFLWLGFEQQLSDVHECLDWAL